MGRPTDSAIASAGGRIHWAARGRRRPVRRLLRPDLSWLAGESHWHFCARRSRRALGQKQDCGMRLAWKCRIVEAVEKPTPLSHRSHNPWKSPGRFPHSHTTAAVPLPSPIQSQKPVRYLLPKQPGRSSMCHPTSRSKVSTITPVAHGGQRGNSSRHFPCLLL